MIEALPFPREDERVATVQGLGLLDTPLQERFEKITRMVRSTLRVPIAHFNLLDRDRQHLKSAQGVDGVDLPMEGSFCMHVIHEPSMLVVRDASKDPRFHDNPYVSGRFLNIRFYAGCPVRAPNGLPIGTLCAIDIKPRKMSPECLAALRDLADMIETELRVSSLSKAQENLLVQLSAAERLARIDPLTRLWNRGGIMELVEKEWSEGRRHHKPVTLALIDIDHFKAVNDVHGHSTGDMVIVETAKTLLAATRNEDAVGRFGGEEFLVILTQCTSEGMKDAAERMRLAVLEHAFDAGGVRLQVTVSCGLAGAVPQSEDGWMALIKTADEMLYRAKAMGRNRTVVSQQDIGAAA